MAEVGASTFAEAVRRERDRLGLTQEGLGGLVGATQAAVAKWETGTEPRPRTVFALERVFGLPPGSLSRQFGYVPEGTVPALTPEKAIDTDARLGEQDRAILHDVLRGIRRRARDGG